LIYPIPMKALNTSMLPDGDRILLFVNDHSPSCPDGSIEIGLELYNVAWWKGVQLNDGTVLAQCQDAQISSLSAVGWDFFRTAQPIQLWKAKMFGVHTPMYVIMDALPTGMRAGGRYVFIWEADGSAAVVAAEQKRLREDAARSRKTQQKRLKENAAGSIKAQQPTTARGPKVSRSVP